MLTDNKTFNSLYSQFQEELAACNTIAEVNELEADFEKLKSNVGQVNFLS